MIANIYANNRHNIAALQSHAKDAFMSSRLNINGTLADDKQKNRLIASQLKLIVSKFLRLNPLP
ncbi:hypothetical protein, partial [Arsukibacterium sp.]|uniref:hypothetical protein n=1 Tax=Arsukibacterium sp. TaxID=1977258 RepID=UPI002FD9DF23